MLQGTRECNIARLGEYAPIEYISFIGIRLDMGTLHHVKEVSLFRFYRQDSSTRHPERAIPSGTLFEGPSDVLESTQGGLRF